MGNIHFKFTGVLLFLIASLFIGCDNDCETQYEGYGLVKKSNDRQYSILLDNGIQLYPRESHINPDRLRDSMRLCMLFNILEETDSSAYVRILYADTMLTKAILPYDETILDSVGQDPVKITDAWFAHGFLNFQFMFAGRINSYGSNHAHMVNLLQCPPENEKLVFEFRHNDFDDYREKLYYGVVSFPIHHLLADQKKPIPIKVKYNDTENSTKTIELTYKD